MRRRRLIAAMLGTILIAVSAAPAASQTRSQLELRATRAMTPPKLDGVLDDAVWTGQPMALDDWVSYNPLRGEPGAAAHQRLDRLRHRRDLLRIPVL